MLNAIDSTLKAVVSNRCLGAELKLSSALWVYGAIARDTVGSEQSSGGLRALEESLS